MLKTTRNMAPLTIINVVVYSLFTYAVRATSAQQQPEDRDLGEWYSVIGDQLKLCVFPFRYDHVDYSDCRSGSCATVANFSYVTSNVTVDNITYGMCSKVVQRDPAPVVSINYKSPSRGNCFVYTSEYTTSKNEGILYAQLKKYIDCQQHCDAMPTCQGINFDRDFNYCFLRFNDRSANVSEGRGYDNYTRYSKDIFNVHVDNTAPDGILASVYTYDIAGCFRQCNKLLVTTSWDYCVGFDFYSYRRCLLHTANMTSINVITTINTTYHFTRQVCSATGIYEYSLYAYINRYTNDFTKQRYNTLSTQRD